MKTKLIEFYMEYVDTFGNFKLMAVSHGMTAKECRALVLMGKKFFEERAFIIATKKSKK